MERSLIKINEGATSVTYSSKSSKTMPFPALTLCPYGWDNDFDNAYFSDQKTFSGVANDLPPLSSNILDFSHDLGTRYSLKLAT